MSATKHLFFVNAPDDAAIVEGLSCGSTLGLGFIESAYGADLPTLTFVGCTFDLQADLARDRRPPRLERERALRRLHVLQHRPRRPHPLLQRGPARVRVVRVPQRRASTRAGARLTPDPSEVCFVGFESLEKVTFEECNVGERSLPSQVMVLDRVHRTSRISSLNRTYVLPGTLIVASDMSNAPLRVSAEARDIALPASRSPAIRARPARPPSTRRTPRSSSPAISSSSQGAGFVPEHYGPARRSRGVCGVIKSVAGGVVRLASVVQSLSDGKLDLAVKYFPRLHLPSTGHDQRGQRRDPRRHQRAHVAAVRSHLRRRHPGGRVRRRPGAARAPRASG